MICRVSSRREGKILRDARKSLKWHGTARCVASVRGREKDLRIAPPSPLRCGYRIRGIFLSRVKHFALNILQRNVE